MHTRGGRPRGIPAFYLLGAVAVVDLSTAPAGKYTHVNLLLPHLHYRYYDAQTTCWPVVWQPCTPVEMDIPARLADPAAGPSARIIALPSGVSVVGMPGAAAEAPAAEAAAAPQQQERSAAGGSSS